MCGDSEARLQPELIGLAGLALADALRLRGVEGVELVLALGLLLFQPLGAVHGLGKLGHLIRGGLAVDVPQQPANDGALAFDHPAHALVLPGVGVAPGLTVEPRAGAGIALAQLDAGLGRTLSKL